MYLHIYKYETILFSILFVVLLHIVVVLYCKCGSDSKHLRTSLTPQPINQL